MVCVGQTLAQCLALRDAWQETFCRRPSPAVFPGGPRLRRGLSGGEGTCEPLFRPDLVDPPDVCHATYRMEDGVYQVTTDTRRHKETQGDIRRHKET